jgi:hypothetical protein
MQGATAKERRQKAGRRVKAVCIIINDKQGAASAARFYLTQARKKEPPTCTSGF